MAKSVALLLAFAALAATAHAGFHANSDGKITQIFCLESEDGYVAGLAYKNDYEQNYRTFCTQPEGGWYGPYCMMHEDRCKRLVLNAGELENIVRIEACRGGKYGYVNIKVYTDASEEPRLVCGSADPDSAPSDYEKYSKEYQAQLWTASADDKSAGRALLEEVGASVDGAGKGGEGWGGWKTRCQVYNAPLTHLRVEEPANGGWVKNAKYGFTQNGYNKAWQGYSAYLLGDEQSGKTIRYYKDYETYKTESSACDRSCDYVPEYYYEKVVAPLESFKVKCDKVNLVYDIYKLKWNKGYVPPPPVCPNCVVASIALVLDVSCEDVRNDPELLANIQQTLINLGAFLESIDGVEGVDADLGSFKCEGAENGTISFNIVISGSVDAETLYENLQAAGVTQGADLCKLAGEGACLPPVVSAPITYRFQNLDRLKAMLADKAFQGELSKFTLIAGQKPKPLFALSQ